MKISNTWNIPGHITGIFKVVPHDDVLQKGSLGAGFCLDEGVSTKVSLSEFGDVPIKVLFNGQPIEGKVSNKVAQQFIHKWQKHSLLIEHVCPFPIGGGFGTSGAGALGTAFALNELFDEKYSPEKLGQIAHLAEVKTGSGLGDVIGQFYGGTEIRIKSGAPGIGEITKFSWDEELCILSVYLDSLSTSTIITSQKHVKRINDTATQLLENLESDPTYSNFVSMSYQFSIETNLMTSKLKSLVTFLRARDLPASMIMIGQSAFAIEKKDKLTSIIPELKSHFPEAKIWINKLSKKRNKS